MFDYKKLNLPSLPGCYLMRDKEKQIIYVGKAKNLKKRVSSYFLSKNLDYKTKKLVETIKSLEFIVTDNELEALLLEAKLIHSHQPAFNISLKEGNRYAYIKVTQEKFPRLITYREAPKEKENIFGPYADGTARRDLIYLLNKTFKLRVCRRLPKMVCLLYHLGHCFGPCEGKISEKDYLDNVKRAEMVLKGKIKELLVLLEKEMRRLARKQKFEQAKMLRDQILALKKAGEGQKVVLRGRYNQDYLNYLVKGDEFLLQLFNINKGILSGRKQFGFKDSLISLENFITNYYYTNEIPEELVVPHPLQGQALLEKYLSKLKGKKVKIVVPQKGHKQEMLALLAKNLQANLSAQDKVLLSLQNQLLLPRLPLIIECFDISNIGKDYAVGAMVRFKDGIQDKNNYRRFKIKTIKNRQDDFAMMQEIVFRRYFRLQKEKSVLPDLVVIDGGKGQLAAANKSLAILKLSLPVIGLAKKEEEIYFGQDQPLKLKRSEPALKLLQQVRDEAHRFGIKYHRLLRSKGMLK